MKILVVDDHWVFRSGLRHLLRRFDEDVTIVEAGSVAEAQELAPQHNDLALVLLDLLMPGTDPFVGLRDVRDSFPGVPIVVLSALEQRSEVIRSIELGAMGYISKASTGEEILKALRQVLQGDIFVPRTLLASRPEPSVDALLNTQDQSQLKDLVGTLTVRQREVFNLLAQGLSNPEIAKRLGVSAHTVRIHISAILRALGVSNRTQAAVLAASFGPSNQNRLTPSTDKV